MELDKIKDIVTARWKFIASNAESIAKIVRAMEEAEMLDADALKEIRGYETDNKVNLASLEQLLDALSDSAKPFT